MFKRCLLVFAALVLGAQAEKEELVGATDAGIGEFPYQVSLRINGEHFCGGSLITKKHVLTAAHCIVEARDSMNFTAVVGTNSLTSGGKSYRVVEKSQNPSYDEHYFTDDIGVLTLDNEVEVSNLVSLVKLPTEDVKIGSEAIVSGWGTMIDSLSPLSQVLQKLTVKIIDQSTCQSMMPPNIKVQSNHVCTFVQKGKGICSGDSGGPLVQDGVVIGLVSASVPCAMGFPDIFTNVFKQMNYVRGVIGQ